MILIKADILIVVGLVNWTKIKGGEREKELDAIVFQIWSVYHT